MSRLLDPKDKSGRFPFEYRNSATTDVRITWAKAKDQMQKNQQEVVAKVRVFPKVKP